MNVMKVMKSGPVIELVICLVPFVGETTNANI